MKQMEIYVHGTPRGHQNRGAETHRDYISTFYNRNNNPAEKTQLQIDLIDGVSFYTYKRFSIVDTEGRPDSYFAMTVAFGGQYCSDVYTLYNLLDAVYKKFGSLFIKTTNQTEQYVVADFDHARHGDKPAVELIQEVIVKNIENKLESKLLPLTAITTVNKPQKEFNLLEVDSPLFFDCMKNYSIIVSSGDKTTAKRLEAANRHMADLTARNKEMDASNVQLKDKVEALSRQNASLTTQLSQSASASEKRYKAQIDQLTKEKDKLKKERDEAKAKLDKVSSTMNQLESPVKELTRLMAGRFPESSNLRGTTSRGTDLPNEPTRPATVRKKSINSILLCCILVLNIAILVALFLTNAKGQEMPNRPEPQPIVTTDVTTPQKEVAPEESKEEPEETTTTQTLTVSSSNSDFDNFKDCKIDIVNGSSKLSLNKPYELQILKNGKKANVPVGTWSVIAKGVLLNNQGNNKFSIEDKQFVGESVEISYIVDNKTVITRICTIVAQ